MDYQNWSNDSVRNGEVKCARMSLQKNDIGKWIDESCLKSALVVCQKKVVNNIDILTNAIVKLENEQQHQMNMLIPIGFVYTQLPDQSQPANIWPSFNWTDVTSSYAGLFFRAEGGGSEKFGSVQQDNSPKLISVNHDYIPSANPNVKIKITPVAQSEKIFTSWIYSANANGFAGMSFTMSGGEVRPMNKAVKIWKRTG